MRDLFLRRALRTRPHHNRFPTVLRHGGAYLRAESSAASTARGQCRRCYQRSAHHGRCDERDHSLVNHGCISSSETSLPALASSSLHELTLNSAVLPITFPCSARPRVYREPKRARSIGGIPRIQNLAGAPAAITVINLSLL